MGSCGILDIITQFPEEYQAIVGLMLKYNLTFEDLFRIMDVCADIAGLTDDEKWVLDQLKQYNEKPRRGLRKVQTVKKTVSKPRVKK